jgi:hypothetical protein
MRVVEGAAMMASTSAPRAKQQVRGRNDDVYEKGDWATPGIRDEM